MISIVMPTYNQGRYLRESLDSLLTQTYPHWELVEVPALVVGRHDDTDGHRPTSAFNLRLAW